MHPILFMCTPPPHLVSDLVSASFIYTVGEGSGSGSGIQDPPFQISISLPQLQLFPVRHFKPRGQYLGRPAVSLS